MHENQKSQDLTITPATKTDISNEVKDQCYYVFAEHGKWEITKQITKKFDSYYDGNDGWYISKKDGAELVKYCEENELTCILRDVPEDFKTLKRKNNIAYWNTKKELSEREISALIVELKLNINPPVNYEYLWSQQDIFLLTEKGKKLIKALTSRKNALEAISFIENSVYKDSPIPMIDKIDNKFDYLLQNNSEEELIKELQSIMPGMETGFKVGEKDLVFPSGAISIIALPTSHGKTSSLINFSLGALKKHSDLTVHFFSYEESSAAILISFLNTYHGNPVNKGNNKSAITHYLKDNNPNFFEQQSGALALFQASKKEFFENYINSGRLKVHYINLTAEELIKAIKHINKNKKQNLIMIDYIQIVKLTQNKKISRQEELKEICLMLKDCAVEIGIPIVIAAQFNRTVTSESELSPLAIGEAGDLERIASLILGGFNRNFNNLTASGNTDRQGKKVEKESTIYWEILKGRNIGNGHNSVMVFDGNTGKIIQEKRTNAINGFDSIMSKANSK